MMVRSLNIEKDPFRPRDDGEEVLGPGVKNIFRYLGTKDLGLFFQL